tara:strand:+ start:648 stop:998 length:351 start_codon:yes stop_codon:yes gene_type:complete
MNHDQIAHYRSQLEEQLKSLDEASKLHQQQIEESNTSNDFVGADRATDLETLEVDSSVTESELNLVKKIKHAIDRINNESYGTCESCSDEIATARLDAKPSVSLCLSCQESHEAET